METWNYEKRADDKGHIYFDRYRINEKSSHAFPHFHDALEFLFVTKGEYYMHVLGEGRTLKAGEIGFADRYCTHYYLYRGAAEVYVLVVSAEYLSGINVLSKKTFPTFIEPRAGFDQIQKFLESGYEIFKDANSLTKSGFVKLLLGLLIDYCPPAEVKRERSGEIFVETLRYIDEHYAEDITLEFLADKFGYAKSYFSNIFNRFTGMNLRSYLNRRRLSAASALKESRPELPIYKIAELCGFESPNTYYRCVKKYSD